ncbi:RelA/SpoT domain-containing protein [Achromobacter sp.]|uniref:RelA/SpoT domain-containing protein n=1 Tax=Achromobacter sp. TaxID=134375 RepID=UPI00258B60F9|nr:RelA/SpoT domain-containing protein [Achromobacter sp.]
MSTRDEQNEFLERNNISDEDWEKCGIPWETLQEIAKDHDSRREELDNAAQFFARTMQRFPAVHSVRWRIKDTDHLLEKIVRKRVEGSAKYKDIAAENYRSKITDLIGLRALHLFKDECFHIDDELRRTWRLVEKPIAYVREGDEAWVTQQLRERKFKVQPHGAGYRSVHYVCATQPTQNEVLAEIQVRTIFEEGWSEIDHRIRYPNFSDDAVVGYFLTIFNRLAGNADEMGTFVKQLTQHIDQNHMAAAQAINERDSALLAMESHLQKLTELQATHGEAQVQIASLKSEVARLRKASSAEQIGLGGAGVIPSVESVLGYLRGDEMIRKNFGHLTDGQLIGLTKAFNGGLTAPGANSAAAELRRQLADTAAARLLASKIGGKGNSD